MGAVDNPFLADAAERYHHGRPYHHERTLERALRAVEVRRGRAVDVACGTGLSSRALRAHGFWTLGLDVSRPMLAVGSRDPDQVAALGSAEALPVADGTAELLSVSSGVHWFDQGRFYAEARRVLAPGGVLVLYEHGFLAHSPTVDGVAPWMEQVYLQRFPMPPRAPMVGQLDGAPGFAPVWHDERTEPIELDQAGLVAYLLTQSNTVVPVDRGELAVDEVQRWLVDETATFLPDQAAEVPYTFFSRIEVLRPT